MFLWWISAAFVGCISWVAEGWPAKEAYDNFRPYQPQVRLRHKVLLIFQHGLLSFSISLSEIFRITFTEMLLESVLDFKNIDLIWLVGDEAFREMCCLEFQHWRKTGVMSHVGSYTNPLRVEGRVTTVPHFQCSLIIHKFGWLLHRLIRNREPACRLSWSQRGF